MKDLLVQGKYRFNLEFNKMITNNVIDEVVELLHREGSFESLSSLMTFRTNFFLELLVELAAGLFQGLVVLGLVVNFIMGPILRHSKSINLEQAQVKVK